MNAASTPQDPERGGAASWNCQHHNGMNPAFMALKG
jgi:hypothetical protein